MRANGWRGNAGGARTTRTTSRDPATERFPDLVRHRFRAQAPGRLLVADFTYVPLAGGGFACAGAGRSARRMSHHMGVFFAAMSLDACRRSHVQRLR